MTVPETLPVATISRRFSFDGAVELAADHHDLGGDVTFELTFLADRYFTVGFDLAFYAAVDMQAVA